jgi:aldose 1-epimerase
MYPLIPYSGRIAAGRLRHEGHIYALVAHPGGEPHTLHGISQQRLWLLEAHSDQAAAIRYLHEPDAHWPWRFEALQRIVIAPRELSVELTLTNLDTRSMPGGIGAHPYLAYAAGDEVVFKAGPAWPHDADFLPTGSVSGRSQHIHVSGERFEAGDLTLFHGDWDGVLELRRRDGTALRLLADDGLSHLVLHRPMGAPYICIEPVSHVADGFNLHERGVRSTGTRILQPGVSMHARFAMLIE